MREIEFRGKNTITGEWEYGGYDKASDGKSFIVSVGKDQISHIVYIREVEKKTVGQYIGLCDKNGVKIYEGDIVRLHKLDAPKEIRWDDKQSRWCLIQNDYPVAGCNEETLKAYEIIGNIYDNPELLEEAK